MLQRQMKRISKIALRGILRLTVCQSVEKHEVIKDFIEALERHNDCFVTYNIRPKQAKDAVDWEDNITETIQPAIVLQGPLYLTDDFTMETVRLYRQRYPHATIIISTWETEDPSTVEMLRNTGAEVILNGLPEYPGIKNINCQIISTREGIRRAKELGFEYVIKTRTDQRMYAPDILEFLQHLQNVFPLYRENIKGKQKKRLIGCGLNTLKYRMYGLSDMFMYGHIDDMILYWDTPLDTRPVTSFELSKSATLRQEAERCACEVYFCTQFLAKVGHEIRWTLEDSWSVMADRFCIVDRNQLDLFWPKYNRMENPSHYHPLEKSKKAQEIQFRDWLNLYVNLNGRTIPETVMSSQI